MINWDYWNNERDRILQKKYDGLHPFQIEKYVDNEIGRDYIVHRDYDEATGPTLDYAELFLKERCSDLGCDAIINYKTQHYAVGEDEFVVCSGTFVNRYPFDEGNVDYGDYSNEEIQEIFRQITLWHMERVPFVYEVIDSECWACAFSRTQVMAMRQVEFDMKELFYNTEVTDIINVQYHVTTMKEYEEVPKFHIMATGIAVKRISTNNTIHDNEDDF